MNVLCIMGRHRWASVADPGEDPYQWCQRCQRYRSTARWRGAGEPTGRGLRAAGGVGGAEFGAHGGSGGGGAFDGGGFDGGGGSYS